MQRRLAFASAVLVALFSMMGDPARAQLESAWIEDNTCGARDEVTAKLAGKYGETQTATGLVSSNRVLEVWRSADGTWTLLMTRPDGKTCIVAAGSLWRDGISAPGDPT